MIEVRIKCPQCQESLMDAGKLIDGHPSIHVVGESRGRKADIWLSSLYGSYNAETSLNVEPGEETAFFCPRCRKPLKGTRACELCGAAMVPFGFAEGGIVQVCSRKGCKRHLVEFTDIRAELRSFIDGYSQYL
jgi:hypothetical protein